MVAISASAPSNESDLSAVPASVIRAERRHKWAALLLLLAPINAMMVFDRIALIVAIPIIQVSLKLTLVECSVLISAVMWTYGLLQIPAGWCVTRFGIRPMMLSALVLWSLATLATPLAQTYIGLIILRIVLGIGQSPDWPASVATVRSWFDVSDRSKGSALLLAGQYVGAALAGPATTWIISRSNWHVPFFVYGAIGLGLSVAWFLFFQERRSAGSEIESDPPTGSGFTVIRDLARSSQFWALGGAYGCLMFAASFINYMLPNYLTAQRHLDLQTIGWIVGLPSVFLWISVILAGLVADAVMQKTGSVWLARVPAACIGFAIAGAGTGIADWVSGVMPMVACLCISFFGAGLVQVSVWSIVQDLTKDFTGVLAGWAGAWGNLAAAGGPILIAIVVQATGSWKLGLAMPVAAAIVGAALVLATRPQRPISEPEI